MAILIMRVSEALSVPILVDDLMGICQIALALTGRIKGEGAYLSHCDVKRIVMALMTNRYSNVSVVLSYDVINNNQSIVFIQFIYTVHKQKDSGFDNNLFRQIGCLYDKSYV